MANDSKLILNGAEHPFDADNIQSLEEVFQLLSHHRTLQRDKVEAEIHRLQAMLQVSPTQSSQPNPNNFDVGLTWNDFLRISGKSLGTTRAWQGLMNDLGYPSRQLSLRNLTSADASAKILRLGVLVAHSERELLRTPNFGPVCLKLIKQVLATYNLHLSMDTTAWYATYNPEGAAQTAKA